MKAIIRRDRTTGAIVDDLGEYELLTVQGKTDEEIAGLVGEYNEKSKDKDRIAELVELDEAAQFYKARHKERSADEFSKLELVAESLQDLASEIDGIIRRMKR